MPTAEELNTMQNVRHFIQYGGSRPGNAMNFAGIDDGYMILDGATLPKISIDPIFVPDPRKARQYKLVGRSYSPPDLPTATIQVRERKGGIPRPLLQPTCEFTFFDLVGECRDLSDFLAGWEGYVMVYAGATTTEIDLGSRSSWDGDDPLEDGLSLTLRDVYPVGSVGFGQEAAAAIDRQVNGVTYGTATSCGNCGQPNDGTNHIYAITASSGAGSPGLPSELIYSTDAGATWNQAAIDGIGATENALAIEVVGQYLMVLGEDAYYYALIDQDTAAPGTFTKVTTGIVAAGTPRDIYVDTPRAVFLAGDGGYIYKATDITSGVTVINAGDTSTEDLKRIHGDGQGAIVAVGANGAVVYSVNRGFTWALAAANPDATATLQALWVFDQSYWWIGTNGGKIWYTETGGKSWTERTFSGSGSGQVYDIVAANSEVIWFSHSTSAPAARVFSTWNGGSLITNTSPRIVGLPVFDIAYRLAVPTSPTTAINANYLAVGGLAGDGTDGILLLGAPNVV